MFFHSFFFYHRRTWFDMAMGLVQAFPAERGRQMAAQMEIEGNEQAQFTTGGKS